MVGMVAWIIGFAVGSALLVLAAAQKLYWVHMAIAALFSIAVAVLAFVDTNGDGGRPGTTSRVAATFLRHMGLVFCWGTVAMALTYGSGILTWREWWQFLAAFIVLAGISLLLAASLRRDGDADRDDATMLRLARLWSTVMLVAMPLVMAGLALHDGRAFRLGGKMLNFFTEAGQRANWQDWGANNVFFFGALAVAVLALRAAGVLRTETAK